MKHFSLLLFSLLLATSAFSQTQQGFVKTKGRMVNGQLVPGQGLKGATVSVQGRTPVLVNKDDGAFSFPTPENQFKLDSVKKKGYQLVDMDACPRTYKTSGNPLYIVMETPEQQLQDKLNAERKIRRNLQKQLQVREDEIETLKEQQKISDEEYRQALQKLYQDQENNEQLISDMAKRYSELDYDQLDEFYRQVSYCIENGELVKADSLLNTRGDITAQVGNILQRGQTIAVQDEQLQKAKAVQQADIDEAAQRCYSYYETFKAQHLNDTAAYYLELRASLDTTNVEWLMDAGEFINEFVSDYSKALYYYHVGLRQVQLQKADKKDKMMLAVLYYDIATANLNAVDFDNTIHYYNKALDTWKSISNIEQPDMAYCYNGMGRLYFEQGNYNNALECFKKALAIGTVFSESNDIVAQSNGNIGVVYDKQGDFDKALEYHIKALIIEKKTHGEDHPSLASDYNNIGIVYADKGDYNKALEYYDSASFIWETVYGKNHPKLSTCYNNIGLAYYYLGSYENAMAYYNKCLAIHKRVFGDSHPLIATVYNNMGLVYSHQGDYGKALEFYSDALSIWKSCSIENIEVANCYYNHGMASSKLGDNYLALDSFSNSLTILKSILGENHQRIARNCNNIGFIYSDLGDYIKALEYHNIALTTYRNLFGEEDHNVAKSYNNIGIIYYKQGNYEMALKNLNDALTIWKSVYGESHSETAETYYNIGGVYCKQEDFSQSLEYYNKALSIWKEVFGPEHRLTQMAKAKLSEIQAKMAEQENK